MADVKWIKLSVGLPDNKKIKQIRRLPEGDTIALMWIFLMCLAGETNENGMVYFTPEIPYTDEMLADHFNMDIGIVRMALQTFQRFGMLEIIDDIICLDSWEKYQNIEGMDKIREQNRIRKQRQRTRQKQALIGTVNVCEYCGKEGTTVDHLIPKTKGGLDVPENTVCSCLSCSMKKTNRGLDLFLNELLLTSVEFELDRILSNPKIMKHVIYDDMTSRFLSRNVTGHVTQSHATDKDTEEDKDIKNKYIYIVDYLNQKAGTKYKASSKKTQTCIHARLAEGFTEDDFKVVIDKKCAEWLGTEFEQYLRPETLFGTKFESYLNAKVTKKQPTNTGLKNEELDSLDDLF